ncbi:MAG: aminopeptidase P N-terminal domain-containing protein [Fidelibacterota bacterium]|nr:MAG: aminopeptidase P N-terminal domain-containing protein [Candidatus Neomarinimicrobiota bacterium]
MLKLVSLLVLITLSWATARITPEIYRQRRAAVRAQLGPGERIVLLTETVTIRNGDVEHEFRPNSDFWYLTGFGEPEAALVLTGEDVSFSLGDQDYRGNEFLFLREKNPVRERWTGIHLGAERAPGALLIDHALPIDIFTDALPYLMQGTGTIYVNLNRDKLEQSLTVLAEATLQWVPKENGVFIIADAVRRFRKRLRARTRGIKPPNWKIAYKSTDEIIHPMRLRKSASELEVLQRAVDVTGDGLVAAIQRVHPGLYEYQVQATIEYEFKDNGAQREGFPSIVASGPNALNLHYSENSRQLQSGELLLMDVGAEVDMYTADVARTVPVSGSFSPTQRELYGYLLEVQAAAAAALKPGITINELNQVAREVLEEKGYDQYFIHNLSHWLGMDVHDVGRKATPAEPGMILTIEPGIYIPVDDQAVPQSYRGIGMRLEDDFLVTEKGAVILSGKIPRTIEEIESLMKQ